MLRVIAPISLLLWLAQGIPWKFEWTCLDSANNRLLVTDYGLDAILAVAWDTGNRSIISQGGDDAMGSGDDFNLPWVSRPGQHQ